VLRGFIPGFLVAQESSCNELVQHSSGVSWQGRAVLGSHTARARPNPCFLREGGRRDAQANR